MTKRILIVSLGSIGQRHLRNARDLLPGAEFAVWRHNKSAGVSEAETDVHTVYSAQDAIDFNPDAVIVASPASTHVEKAAPFIDRGVNVFIEKPLEIHSDKVSGLAQRCAAGGGFVMIGYVLRFQPIMSAIKSFLAEGGVGDVRTALMQTGQYLPDWRPSDDYRNGVSAQKDLGGGVMLELSHELDYARWFFGEPESVIASLGRLSQLDIDVEDSAHVLYEYTDKRVAIQIDFLQRVARMHLQVIGSEATLEVDLISETGTLFEPAAPSGRKIEFPRQATGNEMYLRQFDVFFAKSFAEYVPRYEGSRAYDGYAKVDDAIAVLRLVDAAKQSNIEGRRALVS